MSAELENVSLNPVCSTLLILKTLSLCILFSKTQFAYFTYGSKKLVFGVGNDIQPHPRIGNRHNVGGDFGRLYIVSVGSDGSVPILRPCST